MQRSGRLVIVFTPYVKIKITSESLENATCPETVDGVRQTHDPYGWT